MQLQHYSTDEESHLIEMWNSYSSLDEISLALGRSRASIKRKAIRLGLKRDKRKMQQRDLPKDFDNNEKQIIIGSLLGDASIIPVSQGSCLFEETHSIKQKKYLEWKHDNMNRWKPSVYETNSKIRMVTKPHELFSIMREIWYPEGMKIVPTKEIETMDYLALSCLIGDDGAIRSKNTRDIYSMGFTMDENHVLADIMSDVFHCRFIVKSRLIRGNKYPFLYIPATSWKILKPNLIPLPSVEYKF